jgi:hypothetical protein
MVNATGRLGLHASSARFKRDIHDMGDSSAKLMELRPVTFRYKEDPTGALQYGLIAEEVARVYPGLVIYGTDGEAESVAYHLLPAMLLNELQKQVRDNQRKDVEMEAMERRIAAQRSQINSLEAQTARIDKLTARLDALEEQARVTKADGLALAH